MTIKVAPKLIRLLLLSAFLVTALLIARFTQAQLEEDRVAFVIGNSEYAGSAKLANPTNDSTAISEELKRLGFETYLFQNLKVEDVPALEKQLEERLKRNTRLVFYYAGHGVQLESKNYLLPINASFKNAETVANQSLYLGDILQTIQKARPRLSVVVLDACRDNPFGSDKSVSGNKGGLARVDPPTSTVIFYATRPGGTASDGDDKNGLFTKALLAELKKPDVTLEVIFRRVSTAVYDFSKGDQEPWIEGVIREEFVVNQGVAVKPIADKPIVQVAANAEPSAPQKVPTIEPLIVASSPQVVEVNKTTVALSSPSSAINEKPTSDISRNTEPVNNKVDEIKIAAIDYKTAFRSLDKVLSESKDSPIDQTYFACDANGCLPYKHWVKQLVAPEMLDEFKKKLASLESVRVAPICEFDLKEAKCKKNFIENPIVSPLSLVLFGANKSTQYSFGLKELKVTNNGGLSYQSSINRTGPLGITPSCGDGDSRIDFSNSKIDFNIARINCFGIGPVTNKFEFDVLAIDLEKFELILRWKFSAIGFMAISSASGVSKLTFQRI